MTTRAGELLQERCVRLDSLASGRHFLTSVNIEHTRSVTDSQSTWRLFPKAAAPDQQITAKSIQRARPSSAEPSFHRCNRPMDYRRADDWTTYSLRNTIR